MTKLIRLLSLVTASLLVLPVQSETLIEIYERSLRSDPSLKEADGMDYMGQSSRGMKEVCAELQAAN